MSLFDGYKKATHSTVSKLMGDVATWVPSDGSATAGITVKVLFSNPTKEAKVNGAEFDPLAAQIEFYKGGFPTLKEKVDNGEIEIVRIKETDYYVRKVTANWDGDISKADLQEVSEE